MSDVIVTDALLDDLRRKAEAATPGKWEFCLSTNGAGEEAYAWVREDDLRADVFMCGDPNRRANVALVRACDRDTILALIAKLREQHARLQLVEKAAEVMDKTCGEMVQQATRALDEILSIVTYARGRVPPCTVNEFANSMENIATAHLAKLRGTSPTCEVHGAPDCQAQGCRAARAGEEDQCGHSFGKEGA